MLKTKKIITIILCLCFLGGVLFIFLKPSTPTLVYQGPITIGVIDYPPYSIIENNHITGLGVEIVKEAFNRMLRENLSAHLPPEYPGVVGLDFLHTLPPSEAAALLSERRQAVEKKFQQLDGLSTEIRQSHLSVDYMHQYYLQEIEWLDKTIDRLRQK